MGQATEQDKRPWKFQIEKHAKATSTTEPVMNTNLSLIIPDTVETEALWCHREGGNSLQSLESTQHLQEKCN